MREDAGREVLLLVFDGFSPKVAEQAANNLAVRRRQLDKELVAEPGGCRGVAVAVTAAGGGGRRRQSGAAAARTALLADCPNGQKVAQHSLEEAPCSTV